MTFGLGSWRHVKSDRRDCMTEPMGYQFQVSWDILKRLLLQIFPNEQGENRISAVEAVGLIMKLELLSHCSVERGQHAVPVALHPETH